MPPKPTYAAQSELRQLHFDFTAEAAPAVAPLQDTELHMWHANCMRGARDIARLTALLSTDEQERMARFRFEADRQNFAFARGMLRTILGKYLRISPADVRFSYSQQGKPFLAVSQQASRVQFNLSHTAGYVLLAVCLDASLGVDVEKLRNDIETEDLTERFFSSAERKAIRALPKAQQRRGFFHCWTRKESLLKAKGGGLLLPLDTFDVSVSPKVERIRLVTRPHAEEALRWRIFDVVVPEEFAAAVSVQRL